MLKRAAMLGTRPLLRTVGTLGIVFVLAACLPTPPPYSGSGPKVGLAGDSQMWLAEHGWENTDHVLTDAVTAAGYQASVTAKSGETSSGLTGAVWPSRPDVTVMVMGTNDQWQNVPLATTESTISGWWASTGARCNVAVELVEKPGTVLATNGAALNAWFRSHATVTVPWASTVVTHPEYLSGDGVHPTTVGLAAYRAAMVQAVLECP